ncbi:MAG: sodium:solute symporter, partial [Cyclobacteriaceae bacterium]|nr:sodium:solute symporter [Cyclobacteriaceae bacterium]
FIQFYFGLPIAMVVVSFTFVPIFHKLKVFTAYEYLESRFDLKTRILGALLFLIQRGLAAGITIYAPSIVLTSLLGWNLTFTIIFIGTLVIIYTVSGGTKAVSQTQKHQMAVMMGGIILVGIVALSYLPEHVGIIDALKVAGKMDKLNIVTFDFDVNDRYNIWSGLIGGFFLAMAYFGTDQSQVQRYLTGKSITESRLGLLFNGLLKIPMQFVILFIGILVFLFYQFNLPPVFFNDVVKEKIYTTEYSEEFRSVEESHKNLFERKRGKIDELISAFHTDDNTQIDALSTEVKDLEQEMRNLENEASVLISKSDPSAETEDRDYIFLSFIMKHMPQGIIGLLLAVIFSAAMSSTSSELNALGSTTTIDFYKRNFSRNGSDREYLIASKVFTLVWGLLAITFATFASQLENLIQAVNILGSLFYGTILGLFVVSFYIKFVKGTAVFIAGIIGQTFVVYCFFFTEIAYLNFNIIGCITVVLVSMLLQAIIGKDK